jgi:SAM-dependent methyltransferase
MRVLDELNMPPFRAVELGCGTGANAVLLAERGFETTAVDVSPTALALARVRAIGAGVSVNFIEADVTTLICEQTFGFVFDRGCYHSVRRENLAGYRATVARLTRPGSRILVLAGNSDEPAGECGMPRVSAAEIARELGPLGALDRLCAFRFDEGGPGEGPLGWSCLFTRR